MTLFLTSYLQALNSWLSRMSTFTSMSSETNIHNWTIHYFDTSIMGRKAEQAAVINNLSQITGFFARTADRSGDPAYTFHRMLPSDSVSLIRHLHSFSAHRNSHYIHTPPSSTLLKLHTLALQFSRLGPFARLLSVIDIALLSESFYSTTFQASEPEFQSSLIIHATSLYA